MLAHILKGFLDHSQHHRLLGAVQPGVRCSEVRDDVDAGEGRRRLRRIADRSVEAELIEQRRTELTDEGPDVAELASQQLAHEPELGARHPGVAVEDALDVFDLEDRIGQGLGGSIVDLLGQARPFGFLGLDDPHLDVGRCHGPVGAGDERRVAALEEQPGVLKGPMRELEPRELGLVASDIGLQTLDIRAERARACIVGPGLRGLRGRWLGVGRILVGDPLPTRPAVRPVELVAQGLVARQLIEERGTVLADDGIEAVGGIRERGFGLGMELIEAAISSVADPRAVHVARV